MIALVILTLAWFAGVAAYFLVVFPKSDAIVAALINSAQWHPPAAFALVALVGILLVITGYFLFRAIIRAIWGKPEESGERFHYTTRFLRWMRDHDSPAARNHYIKWGVRSSRIYMAALPIMIAFISTIYASGAVSELTVARITMFWVFASTIAYLWYQGKEPMAHPVVVPADATKDLINSILPAISLGGLLILWVAMNFFHMMGWLIFPLNYSEYGWYMFAAGVFAVLYDLLINTNITLILSTIPPRVEHPAVPAWQAQVMESRLAP